MRRRSPKLPVFDCSTSQAEPLRLTPGQGRLLELMFTGMTNKEMAQRLNVSVSAIKHRLRIIYAKMGIPGNDQKKYLQCMNKFGHFEVSVKWVPKV